VKNAPHPVVAQVDQAKAEGGAASTLAIGCYNDVVETYLQIPLAWEFTPTKGRKIRLRADEAAVLGD